MRAVYCLLASWSFALTGCATVLGSHEKLFTLNSTPDTADVYLDGGKIGTTPAKVKLDNHKSHTFTFKKEGYSDAQCMMVERTDAGWVIADVLLGGLLAVIVDAATGDWTQTKGDRCHGNLQVLPYSPQPMIATVPSQGTTTPPPSRSATPLRDQVVARQPTQPRPAPAPVPQEQRERSEPVEPRPRTAYRPGDIPDWAQFVGDRRTRYVYNVHCPAVLEIPEEERVFFETYQGTLNNQFVLSSKC